MTRKPPGCKQRSDGPANPVRFWEVDCVRGVAILLMVLYHFIFFFWMTAPSTSHAVINPFALGWLVVARSASTIFLILVGVALVVSFQKTQLSGGERSDETALSTWRSRMVRRSVKLFFWGVLLSALTTALVPGYGIVFGVLHLIAVGSVVVLPFVGMPLVALGATVFFATASVWHPSWVVHLATQVAGFGVLVGLPPVGFQSLDYWPLFPWTALITLGVVLGNILFVGAERRYNWPATPPSSLPPPSLRVLKFCSWLGERSLVVYLIHIPVVGSIVLLLHLLR